jgi:hypothetical protein
VMSNPASGEVHSMQNYVIKFESDKQKQEKGRKSVFVDWYYHHMVFKSLKIPKGLFRTSKLKRICYSNGDNIVVFLAFNATFNNISVISFCLCFILFLGPSWSYGSWINNYLCNQCLSPLKLWCRIPLVARCNRCKIKH